MALREELSRLLEKHSVGEITKELSVFCSRLAEESNERGDTIYAEQLTLCADALWSMDFGI